MKKFSAVILTVALLLDSCREQEAIQPTHEKVQFTLALVSPDMSGGRGRSNLPDGAYILISLSDKSGVSVMTNHKVGLLTFGETYISEPIELERGYYNITDFMIVNESSEVLYAVPKRGSGLAPLVHSPLPYGFGVGGNLVKNISMEVIDVYLTKPEDFGYISFDVQIVYPWRLAVFVIQNGKVAFTEAEVLLVSDEKEKYEYSALPKVNLLAFKGNPEDNYILVIKKNGYQDYRQPFNYSDVAAKFGSRPIKVILQKEAVFEAALTIVPAETISPQETLYGFAIDFNPPLAINVDWGDGSMQPFYFDYQKFADFSHNYENGLFPISITGDLDKIWHFSNDAAAAINTSSLAELKELSVYRGDMINLDLTSNKKLVKLIFTTCSIDTLVLPTSHNISDIIMDGVSTENIDDVIKNVYENAVQHSTSEGRFYLDVSHAPTSDSMEKLAILADTYSWHITVK